MHVVRSAAENSTAFSELESCETTLYFVERQGSSTHSYVIPGTKVLVLIVFFYNVSVYVTRHQHSYDDRLLGMLRNDINTNSTRTSAVRSTPRTGTRMN